MGLWNEIPNCINYKDSDYDDMPFEYNSYHGRVVHKYEETCGRCDNPIDLRRGLGRNTPFDGCHNNWCINNNDVEEILRSFSPEDIEYAEDHKWGLDGKSLSGNHLVDHIGHELSKASKNLYYKMLQEQPNNIDNPEAVDAYMKKHKFVEKIVPDAITKGHKQAIKCMNPYNNIDWS